MCGAHRHDSTVHLPRFQSSALDSHASTASFSRPATVCRYNSALIPSVKAALKNHDDRSLCKVNRTQNLSYLNTSLDRRGCVSKCRAIEGLKAAVPCTGLSGHVMGGFTLIWKDPGTVKSPLPSAAWQAGISLFENTTQILVSATDPQAKKKKKNNFFHLLSFILLRLERAPQHTLPIRFGRQRIWPELNRTRYTASACAHQHHAIKALCVCSTPILTKVIKAVNNPLRLCEVKFQSW